MLIAAILLVCLIGLAAGDLTLLRARKRRRDDTSR
jgi:hypothetical protein